MAWGGRGRYVLMKAVSADMYKRSVKDKVRWKSDNANKRYPARYGLKN